MCKLKLLSAQLNKHRAMDTDGGMKIQAPPFLTLALDGIKCSASRRGRFTLGEEPLLPIM